MRTGENIYKRKDGRWEARYQKDRNADGRIIYGSCYGKTYKEAKTKAAEAWKTNSCKKPLSESPALAFGVLCDEWLKMNRIRLKESTCAKYTTVIENHLKPYFGQLGVCEINSELIVRFGENLTQVKGLSAKTVKDTMLILHSIIKYGQCLQPESPKYVEFIYPKDVQVELRVLSSEEQTALTNFLTTELNPCRLGVLLALWTGIRIGELCALRWDHIDLNESCIHIDATMQRLPDTRPNAPAKTKIVVDTPKSPSAIRTIPLTPRSVEVCRKMHPADPSAYVLTGNKGFMEPRILQYHFSRYAQSCGLKGVHFHTLRHTFATRSIEVGFEIKSLSEILGHANTSITLNRYVHCSMKLKRDNMLKLQAAGM